MRCIGYCYYPHMLPTEYHMFCELKQAVLLLEQEFTPVEIRIGRGKPRLGSSKQEYRCYFIRFRHPIRYLVCGFIRNGLTTG